MTSPRSRRVVSQGSLDRQNSQGDDPWCLTCGANLALEGRTFTIVSRHSNGDLCDIFSRVLGAEFSPDYASVNVCNRCERQLRRLGRYSSIILARHEGEKLREQLEKNLAKHGQKVLLSGDIQDLHSPTSATGSPPPKPETFTARNSRSYESHSSLKKSGKTSTRSVSSVHFEDEAGANGVGPAVRKDSAPDEGGVRKRSSLSPFSEGVRRREIRRRKWSSASSTSEENAPSSHTNLADRKLSQESRGVALESHAEPGSDQKVNHIDQRDNLHFQESAGSDTGKEQMETSGDTSGSALSEENKVTQENQTGSTEKNGHNEEPSKDEKSESLSNNSPDSSKNTSDHTSDQVKDGQEQTEREDGQKEDGHQSSGQDSGPAAGKSERINPFDSNKQKAISAPSFDMSASFDDDVFVVGSGQQGRHKIIKMDTVQADEELMKKLDENSLNSESGSDEEEDEEEEEEENDVNAETRSNLSEVEARINTKTKFKGAYYNIGSTEDLLQEFANEQDRDRARWSQLTFTESLDVEDPTNPVRPARRPKAKQRKKGRKHKTQVETIPEGQDTKTEDGVEGKAQGNETAANGPVQDGEMTTKRSEKSPLIGKESSSLNQKLKNGNESRIRDQQPGFLCCNIL